LQSAWSGVSGFFEGIWHGIQGVFGNIGGWFHDRFSDAKNKAQQGWSGVSSFFQGQAKTIQTGFQDAANGIVQGFQWMYNHNHYFKDTVDFARAQWKNLQLGAQYDWNLITSTITKTLDILKSWITGWWNDQVSNWNTATSTVSGIVTTLWNDVKNAYNTAINFIWSIIKPYWDLEVAGWNVLSGTVSGIARSLWGSVTGAFRNGIAAVQGALAALWTLISNGWNTLVSQAEGWGRALIQGVINGISSLLGSLGNMASQAASTVASFLGFHSPTERGPGSTLNEWGPGMVRGFSAGIIQSIPMLESAMQQLTQSLGIPGISTSVNTALALPQGTSVTAPLQGVAQVLAAASAGNAQGQGMMQEIILMLDSQVLGTAQGNTMMKQIRLKAGLKA
jgi:phage-related protein